VLSLCRWMRHFLDSKETNMPIPVNPSAPIHEVPAPVTQQTPQPVAPPAPPVAAEPEVQMAMWMDPVCMPTTIQSGLTTTFHFVVRRGKEALEWLLETRWVNLTGIKTEPAYYSQLVQSPNKLLEKCVLLPSNGGWFAPDGTKTEYSDMFLSTMFSDGSNAVLKLMAKEFFNPETKSA
jgi:hypothetical protein